MACTSPVEIPNPRKCKSPLDPSTLLVPCGRCFECRKRFGNDWRIRLLDEIRYSPRPARNYFVTLSISDDYYSDFCDNPTLAIRRFNERYRRKFGHSCRHWFVTELGDTTQRLHFHGILFDCDLSFDSYVPALNAGSKRQNLDYRHKSLSTMWKYGFVFVGYCTSRTASYIVKYITKTQTTVDGSLYIPKIFTSAGIGSAYCSDPINVDFHRDLDSFIIKRDGFTYALPRYYKNKLYSANELRLEQLRYYQLSDRPLYFKGHTYPDTPFGRFEYFRALSIQHSFNSTIYANNSSSRELFESSRQRFDSLLSDAQWKRSIDEDSTMY